jgi:hypothetical protein
MRKNSRVSVVLATLMAVLAAATLHGCKQEVDLSFETIERKIGPGNAHYFYQDKEPKAIIIAGASDIDALGNTVSLNAQRQLRALDLNQYLAIAVFQGWRPVLPTPRSGIEVTRITREGDTVTIYALSYGPVEEHVRKEVEISAYHVVKVEKGEGLEGNISLVLNVEEVNVAE